VQYGSIKTPVATPCNAHGSTIKSELFAASKNGLLLIRFVRQKSELCPSSRSVANALRPDRSGFDRDPFGYSALAGQKWAMAQALAGLPVDPRVPPTSRELKSPFLWLAHAHALSEAACAVLRHEPAWETMPIDAHGVCDSQYCAVALMLIGYSLEVCLKGMSILRLGVDTFAVEEREHRHHDLDRLADFVPELDERSRVILRLLSHFTIWAGRYPDPGSRRHADLEPIFVMSEQHKLAAKDLFILSTRIMRHASVVVDATA
jgi:hypothetical protein